MKNFKLLVLLYLLFISITLYANGEKASLYEDTGQVLLYNKKYEKAAAYYYQLIAKNPLSINAHRNYQNACFAMDDSVKEETQKYYHSLLQTDKNSSIYNYLYGRCLPCLKGVEYFETAINYSSCDAWALNAKGACYFENGDLHNAKEEFLKTIKCHPDFGEAYQNLSQVYLQKKQLRRAKKVFRKLIARNRKSAKSYEWLGDMYLNQEMYNYAILGYQKAERLGVTEPGIFFKLGYACFKESKYLLAKNSYIKSITYGNTNYEVYYNIGSTFELLDMPEEALEYYQQAYNKKNNNAVLYSMGNCAVQLGLYSKAIESYNEFINSEPENREALIGLANAYQQKKEYDNAINIYNKIITIDSNYAKAYYNLGSIYAYYLKDYKKMKQYWGKYIDLFPNEKDSRFIRKEMEKINNY